MDLKNGGGQNEENQKQHSKCHTVNKAGDEPVIELLHATSVQVIFDFFLKQSMNEKMDFEKRLTYRTFFDHFDCNENWCCIQQHSSDQDEEIAHNKGGFWIHIRKWIT